MSGVGLYSLMTGRHSGIELIANDSLFASYITEFQLQHATLSALFASLLIVVSATRLGRIVSTQNICGVPTSIQLPILGALLWSVTLGENYLVVALVATLASHALGGFILTVRNNYSLANLFDATLAISLLPALYTPSIVLWFATPIILTMVVVTLREWIVALVGLLLPIAMVSYIYWLCGSDLSWFVVELYQRLYISSDILSFSTILPFRMLLILLSMALSILSLIWVKGHVHKSRVRLNIAAVLLFVPLLGGLFPSVNHLIFALLAPAAALLTVFSLVNLRGKVANTLYFMIIALAILAMITPLDLPFEPLKLRPIVVPPWLDNLLG
ncbi:MAG: hypothetical protein SNF69_06560 [Rikenellaceae bacterium]